MSRRCRVVAAFQPADHGVGLAAPDASAEITVALVRTSVRRPPAITPRRPTIDSVVDIVAVARIVLGIDDLEVDAGLI
jgi:hypothetical protein